MKVTQAEFQNMKEEIIKDLIAFRMEDTGCSMQQAFDDVYHSRLFEKLCIPESGLYIQSSKYVYSYLLDELESLSVEVSSKA